MPSENPQPAARDNVETIRKTYALFNERRIEEWLMLFDPDLDWHARADEPDAATHHGREGLLQLTEAWVASFPDLNVDAEEFVDLGDWVLGVTRLRGSGSASGIDVDDAYVFAHRFQGGLIVETWEYRSKEEALEAVGRSGR